MFSRHVEITIDDLKSEGNREARGKTFPTYLFVRLAQSLHEPDVAHQRRNRRRAVFVKCETTQHHERTIGILKRHRNFVDKVGLVPHALGDLEFRGLGPTFGGEILERNFLRRHRLDLSQCRCRLLLGSPPNRDRGERVPVGFFEVEE